MKPSLLFYCQHSVGLGHLMRAYALAARLAERFRVVLVCGGTLPEGIEPPPGVEIVALPALGVGPGGRFGSDHPPLDVERAWQMRGARIMAALAEARPSVVLVELFPFGRARFAREIVPLLEAARAAGALTACSVRDILVTGRADQREHDDRASELANAHLDVVLVHGDPRFARLEETFRPRVPLTVPVHYTGYVVRDREPVVLVSAGGGRVGEPLLRAAIAAQPRLGVRMRVVAGPLAGERTFEALSAERRPGLEVVRSVPDLGAELRQAAASVSQCGYNTALELLGARIPALVVPYVTREEDEQMRRARRLERLGAVRVLDPAELDPARLAEEIEGLLASAAVDLDGARRSRDLLWELATTPAVA